MRNKPMPKTAKNRPSQRSLDIMQSIYADAKKYRDRQKMSVGQLLNMAVTNLSTEQLQHLREAIDDHINLQQDGLPFL